MEFNSSTIRGKSNVAIVTLGSLGALGMYFKLKGSSKVRNESAARRLNSLTCAEGRVT